MWSEYSVVLKPSRVGGVGVFTTHDIAQGSLIFRDPFRVKIAQIKDIPNDFLPYCIYINSHEVVCPKRFDHMEIGWYINHSFEPNINHTFPDHKQDIISKFSRQIIYALRDIKSGEEILMDYNNLNEPDHLKERYYKKL
jgi:hypothetical protein